MQDGIIENGTAALTSPYCGCGAGTNSGLSFVDPELLRGYVARSTASAFRCTSTRLATEPCARP